MSVVLNIANLILVLTCLTTSQYLSFLFLAMRSTTLFTNRLHSLDMPPESGCEKYSRGEDDLLPLNTLSKYSSFFSFLFSSYTSWRVFFLFDKQLGCETLMSRKVLSTGVQTPLLYVKPGLVTYYSLWVEAVTLIYLMYIVLIKILKLLATMSILLTMKQEVFFNETNLILAHFTE